MDAAGLTLGPIGLTIGDSAPEVELREGDHDVDQPLQSIHSMTTAEWRAKYEKDGKVDLWVEEEFNAGSRLVVRSDAYLRTAHCDVGRLHVHCGPMRLYSRHKLRMQLHAVECDNTPTFRVCRVAGRCTMGEYMGSGRGRACQLAT